MTKVEDLSEHPNGSDLFKTQLEIGFQADFYVNENVSTVIKRVVLGGRKYLHGNTILL